MNADNIKATNIKSKKKKNLTPEVQFRLNLDQCSKTKDLSTAISLFTSATTADPKIHLNHHHFNSLLYICSSSVMSDDPSQKDSAIQFGFRVYNHMISNNISPSEATVTSISRLAAAKDDGDAAFELAKSVGNQGKLRTFSPALFCYCRNGMDDKAFQVEEHMSSLGLRLEESELASLLKVHVEKGKGDKVYEYMHKLRAAVREVNGSTADVIESWFNGDVASDVGFENQDMDQVKEAKLRNGGGWHGLGWLGKGKWHVQRSNVTSDGICLACVEQLICVDTERAETECFAESVASLAMEREVQCHFKEFQDWIEECAGYEAIVDGANVGLYQQNFADGGFSISQVVKTLILFFCLVNYLNFMCLISVSNFVFFCKIAREQLDAVVRELYRRNKKWPLIILHKKRVKALLENVSYRDMLQKWIDDGVLYGTPYGSNDDWYWLYAAVKLKCLLVTNDEMRDHIFELLGSSFFLQWKERHQESITGSWHVPIAGEISDESLRTWLCITRSGSFEALTNRSTNADASMVCQLNCDNELCNLNNLEPLAQRNNADENCDCKSTVVTGKRKERSSSVSELDV